MSALPPPIHAFGGSGTPVIHMAIANGFPSQTYTPLLRPLTAAHRVIGTLPRALWTPSPPLKTAQTWDVMAEDILACLRAEALSDVIAIGHSMGGVASMLAVLKEPQRFRALVLLDPTFLPPRLLRPLRVVRALGLIQLMPPAKKALQRRRDFSSQEAFYEYLRTRKIFSDWTPEALHAYAHYGSRPKEDGPGVTLTWTPEWEAQYFFGIFGQTWRTVPKLRGRLPTLIVRGTASDTFFPDAAALTRQALPEAHFVELQGKGHLFPQTHPEETAALIQAWLEGYK
ncbi:MAG TPA: alpha/beta hydrolase [Aggregatilineales bacterium]|nr:alpha/beta hydrolase [Anaerolineales bacterium]HRE48934.1 alpha/beta hydrolase [Aggregatilineales bacterium]